MDQSLEKLINNRAYQLWQAAGEPSGRDQEFWLQAEKELVAASQQTESPEEIQLIAVLAA